MADADSITLEKPVAKPRAAKKPAAEKVTSKPFASVDDIKLGMTVRDPASGLTGIATMRTLLHSGSVQYAIQPIGDGKSIPEGHFIDDFMLEFVDDGVSARVPPEDPKATFRLGATLKDTVTGITGVAVERLTYLNGCVHYSIQSAKKDFGLLARLVGEKPGAQRFDFKRLVQVKESPDPIPASKKPDEPAPVFTRSPTGGPTRSLRSEGLR